MDREYVALSVGKEYGTISLKFFFKDGRLYHETRAGSTQMSHLRTLRGLRNAYKGALYVEIVTGKEVAKYLMLEELKK